MTILKENERVGIMIMAILKENEGSERLSNLHKVTQLVGSNPGFEPMPI